MGRILCPACLPVPLHSGHCYIITFFIQRYWVEKLQQHVILQARMDAERARLSEMSLKVITAMYSASAPKCRKWTCTVSRWPR